MTRYVLRRIAFMIITLLVISAGTFWMMHSVPGNPLTNMAKKNLPPQVMENFMKKYKLDRPISEQYVNFLKNAVQGDFGESIIYPGQKISKTIAKTAPVSAKLGFIALIIGFTIGVTLGFVAALNRGKWPDYVVIAILSLIHI